MPLEAIIQTLLLLLLLLLLFELFDAALALLMFEPLMGAPFFRGD